MRIKVYKVCGLFVSAIVFGVIKIADAIFDGFYWLKSFAVNLWKLWKLIWTGFEFQNIGRVLMLSLGAFVGAGKMATVDLRQMSEKRHRTRTENVILGTTNTFFEVALFRLTNPAQPAL